MLAETFTRLSRIVTDLGGEVHRYVGDALIATWRVGAPEENARSIQCLIACQDAMAAVRPDIRHRYGVAPDFRAGLHLGPVVVGEIGGFKREITYLGDAMNTAARIEQACRDTGQPLLVSKPLLGRAALPPDVAVSSIGAKLLRGKAERLELFAVTRRLAVANLPKRQLRFGGRKILRVRPCGSSRLARRGEVDRHARQDR